MGSLLSDKFRKGNLRVIQNTGAPSAQTLAAIDQLLIIVPEKPPASLWRKLPHGGQGGKLQALMRRRKSGSVPAITTRVNNKRQSLLVVGTIAADAPAYEQLTFARRLICSVLTEKPGCLGIWALGFSDEDARTIVTRVIAAAHAVAFPLADFKSRKQPAPVKSVRLVGLGGKIDLSRVTAEANGNNLTRWLTAMPPNKLDVPRYVELLKELAKEQGWQFRKYGVAELEKLGAGAFLAVAQGNADDSAAIVRLRYRPRRKKDRGNGPGDEGPAVSLVGKGIIFDTGGNNLKPFQSMVDMHIDMGGSAVAVGSLLAMTELKVPLAIDCWLAITENRIGPSAYKSQDVVRAVNGKSIQIIHTDAEGRLALADTLVLACRDNPRLIIDYATLTGACINAITRYYCGVFTNRPDLHPLMKKAGQDSGERVWPFPLGKDFIADLESDTADLRQCTPDAAGDHILAATFLNEFVSSEIPWIHVDLSALQRKGGLGHVPTDINGFGVRFTLDLLLDKIVLEQR